MKLSLAILICLVTAAACGFTTEPTGGNGSGGPPQFCPDAADAYAQANGLPLPYPANPANPTPFSPSLPPPVNFHPCLNGAGAPTYLGGVQCMVCTDATDQYPDLLPGSIICADGTPDGTAVVCVGSRQAGNVADCDPASQGCS